MRRMPGALISLAAVAAIAAGLAVWSGDASAPFEPSVSDVIVSPSGTGARGNLTVNNTLPAGHHLIRSLQLQVPGGWTVSDSSQGATVGSGVVQLDRDCDGSQQSYPFTMTREEPPGGELSAWYASAPGFMDFLFRVEVHIPVGYEINVSFPWDFHPTIVACTPESFNFTVNGIPSLTNPGSSGPYTFTMIYGSQPIAHAVSRTDCVVIGSGACPTPTASPTAAPTSTATPTPAATATPTASPTPTATSSPVDSDGDGVLDPVDNCPRWWNPPQNLPPWTLAANDPDCDGFNSTVEGPAGTNPFIQCGFNAWPADINNDTFSDITDISALTANFGLSVPPAPARQDIAPDAVDDFIDITDISKMSSFFGFTCAPCPADLDCDAVANAGDNCPNWPNPAQDPPPWPIPANDPDCDGFGSPVEIAAGTDPLSHCGADDWPADINNDTFSDITDLSALTANFGLSVPPAPARQDIAPETVDDFIDISDISKMSSFFGFTCS